MLAEELLRKARELERVEPIRKPPDVGQLLEGLLPEELRQYEALFWDVAIPYHRAGAELTALRMGTPEYAEKAREVAENRARLDWVKRTYDFDVLSAYGKHGEDIRLMVCKGWEVYAVKGIGLEGAGDLIANITRSMREGTFGGVPYPPPPGS